MAVDVNAPNKLGGWAIDKKLYNYIRAVVPDGGTILELGSGAGTHKLAETYTMFSVEHDKKWVDKYQSTYLHVPLCEHKAIKRHEHTLWYDANILRQKLKGVKYDLLLVDGPPRMRSGFFKYMSLFDSNAIWIFDDSDRRSDLRVVESCANKLDRPWTTYQCPKKSFSVMNSPLLATFADGEVQDD